MFAIKKYLPILFALGLFVLFPSCQKNGQENGQPPSVEKERKTAVLLVNHGSHSKLWRNMLLDFEKGVKNELLAISKVDEVRTAFMEYNEPSIATRMKEFDAEGFDEVVVVPIFLTVSSHYSHDIPVILGISSDPKAKEVMVKKEKIEVYKSKAKVSITPPLDYTTLLKKNVARRVQELSENADNEGVLLVAYGDAMYNQQWEEMVDEIGKYLKVKTGHESIAYAWCGHLVEYSTKPTEDGINKLFELEDKAIVIPILVANDPYFQNDIIQKAVDNVERSSDVLYKQDAILPDINLNRWVVDISKQTVTNL